MNSLFTITGMAAARYLSIVRLDRSWHSQTNVTLLSSRYIRVFWGIAFIFAVPPLVGLGQYTKDVSHEFVWYYMTCFR